MIPADRTKSRFDKMVAWGAVGVYFAGAILLLSPYQYLRAILAMALLFGTLVVIARILEEDPMTGMGVLVVAIISGAILLVPEFPAMGGHSRNGLITGAFGPEAAVLLWAAYRWNGDQATRGDPTPLGTCLLWGAGMAVFLSLVASIPIGLAVLGKVEGWKAMLMVYPGYFLGFMAAALVYWSLQSISHHSTGRYLIGVLCGICIYGAVGPIVELFDREAITAGESVVAAVVCGFLVGPAVALGWDNMEPHSSS